VQQSGVRNARALLTGAGLAAALALAACTGPDDISLGGRVTASTGTFLSPAGNDDNDGSREHPWQTFSHAFRMLAEGSTLTLLSGTYDDATTGTLNVRCGDAVITNSSAPNAVHAANGIRVTADADSERTAFIQGNGNVPPLSIDSCSDWTVNGLHVESQNTPDTANIYTAPDTGSVVVLDGPNNRVTLRRLLALKPNLYKHSHLIRVGDGSTDVSVQESELYDFHHNAIEVWRSTSTVLQRNYINSRDTADIMNGYMSDDPRRGDYGVLLEETNGAYVENNIVEDVSVGFGVVGRYAGVGADVPAPPGNIDNNHLNGNIVYDPANIGFRIDSRCQILPASVPACDALHTVRETDLTDDVVIGGATGVSDAGSVATTLSKLSTINAARGVVLQREMQNLGLQASDHASNMLFDGFQSVAFAATDQMMWGCDHCAAVGGYTPADDYEPDDAQFVTNKVNVMPELGGCLVYLPANSPLKGAGTFGDDVGASVVDQYDNGVIKTPVVPLWDATGVFRACGAIVTAIDGKPINGDDTSNCHGLGGPTRLNVASATCPLPP
jgi:hypothetical protein